MVVAGSRWSSCDHFEHMICGIIGINDDLTVTMIAEHAPMAVPTGRFKIAVLDQLLARAVGIANDGYIINQDFAGIEQPEAEFVPKRGTEPLASHHAVGHRLPGASPAFVTICPGVGTVVVGAGVNQFKTRAAAVAPAIGIDANFVVHIARNVSEADCFAGAHFACEVP